MREKTTLDWLVVSEEDFNTFPSQFSNAYSHFLEISSVFRSFAILSRFGQFWPTFTSLKKTYQHFNFAPLFIDIDDYVFQWTESLQIWRLTTLFQ